MRAVVEVEEDAAGAPSWSSPSCPTRSTRTTWSSRSPTWSRTARSPASRDINDESLRPHRHAHRRHAQARRGGQGRAEQPVQAHPAADHLRRQHAGHRRRRAAHAAPRPVRHATTSSTRSRSSSGAPQYRLRKAEERAHILRGLLKALDQLDAVIALIRSSPSADEARDRPDGAARDRRDPGHRHPRPAAAPAGRAGAAADHRRGRRDRGARSPTSTTSWPSRAGSGRSSATS